MMQLVQTIKFILHHPLNRGQAVTALTRYLKWQVGSRMVPGAVAFEWINGSRFLVSPGEAGLTQNIYCGLHEFCDMAFVLHFLREEDFFVDVGSNVGSYSILAGVVVGASGFAVEPVPETYAKLMDNIKINDASERVTGFNLGLSDKPGNLLFTSDLDTTNHVMREDDLDNHGKLVSVGVTSLDKLLDQHTPAFIKIDAEGYETPILEGAKDVLGRPQLRCVLIEINGCGQRYGFDDDKIFDYFYGFGFTSHSYDPFGRRLHPYAPGEPTNGNVIFIRDTDYVLERLATARRYDVHGISF